MLRIHLPVPFIRLRPAVHLVVVCVCSVVTVRGGRFGQSDSSGGGVTDHQASGQALSPKAFVLPTLLRYLERVQPAAPPVDVDVALATNPASAKDEALPLPPLPKSPTPSPSPSLGGWGRHAVQPGQSLVGHHGDFHIIANRSLSASGNVWRARLTTKRGAVKDVAVKFCHTRPRRDPLPIGAKKKSILRRKADGWMSDPDLLKAQCKRQALILDAFSSQPLFVIFYGYWEKRDRILLVMDLMDGDLHDMVITQPFEVVGLPARLALVEQLLRGLRRLAAGGIVHRDISPKNILLKRVDGALLVNLAGFTHACSLPGGLESMCLERRELDMLVGDRAHRAPEAWEKRWTSKGDVFGAGIILYQLLFEGGLPHSLPVLLTDSEVSSMSVGELTARLTRHCYDLKGDKPFAAAKAAAEASQDLQLVGLLALVERMLHLDERHRVAASEAATELAAIGVVGPGTELLLRAAKAAAEIAATGVPAPDSEPFLRAAKASRSPR